MAENLGRWRSKREPISKFGPAKGIQPPWRWDRGMISTNLGVIWEMSVEVRGRRVIASSSL